MNFQGGPGQSPQQQSLAAPGGPVPVPVPGPSGPQPGGPPPPQFGLSNSAAIRAEIGRFESVHPNIYAIYDLIERVEDLALQSQIREHVISIEGEANRAGPNRTGSGRGHRRCPLSPPASAPAAGVRRGGGLVRCLPAGPGWSSARRAPQQQQRQRREAAGPRGWPKARRGRAAACAGACRELCWGAAGGPSPLGLSPGGCSAGCEGGGVCGGVPPRPAAPVVAARQPAQGRGTLPLRSFPSLPPGSCGRGRRAVGCGGICAETRRAAGAGGWGVGGDAMCRGLRKLKMQKTAVAAHGTGSGKAALEPRRGMDGWTDGGEGRIHGSARGLGGGSQQPSRTVLPLGTLNRQIFAATLCPLEKKPVGPWVPFGLCRESWFGLGARRAFPCRGFYCLCMVLAAGSRLLPLMQAEASLRVAHKMRQVLGSGGPAVVGTGREQVQAGDAHGGDSRARRLLGISS